MRMIDGSMDGGAIEMNNWHTGRRSRRKGKGRGEAREKENTIEIRKIILSEGYETKRKGSKYENKQRKPKTVANYCRHEG